MTNPSHDNLLTTVSNILDQQGYTEFLVKNLELVPDHAMDEHLLHHSPLPSILADSLNAGLVGIGMGHLRVKNLDLALRISSPCPAGEIPQQVCIQLPDGTVRCSIKCVKATP